MCLLWGWELGEGRGRVLCLGHVPVTSLAGVPLPKQDWVGFVGFILGVWQGIGSIKFDFYR